MQPSHPSVHSLPRIQSRRDRPYRRRPPCTQTIAAPTGIIVAAQLVLRISSASLAHQGT